MKDAITYANEAGFFAFNVIGWKSEFERLIASIRAEYEAPLKLAEESLVSWFNSYGDFADQRDRQALAAVREALAELNSPDWLYDPTTGKPITDHIADTGKMVAEPVPFRTMELRVKQELNWGTNKFMPHEQPVKQEPVAWDLAEKVRRDLDRHSCPDAYMRIAMESIVKHYAAPVQPVKQEPVALGYLDVGEGGYLDIGTDLTDDQIRERLSVGKHNLYAAPVELQWVDLTDDELKAALEVHQVGLSVRIGRIAIAAFKRKNK